MIIKCISLWEPWATAMALNFKKNETRHWPTSYRGPLAIHAARKFFRPNEYEPEFIQFLAERGLRPGRFQYGHVVCIVDLIGITGTEAIKETLSAEEIMLGEYSPGRYAWRTDNLRVLPKPVPLTGRQALFDWEVPLELEHLITLPQASMQFQSAEGR